MTNPFKKVHFGSDLWGHFYGVIGIISLVFTAVYTYNSIVRLESAEDKVVIQSFALALLGITITFVFGSWYFFKTVRTLQETPFKLKEAEVFLDQLNVSKKLLCENNHSINHYFRNICYHLDLINLSFEKEIDLKDPEIDSLLERSETFMNKVTIALQQYYSMVSGFTCAVTLKVVNSEKGLVKTLYRDPLSLRKRRRSDKLCYSETGCYSVNSNTAFRIILDENYADVTFACDDLAELHNNHEYDNSNQFWHDNYNACIVSPISIVTGENERSVIGFLSIDNKEGNLNNISNIEYLLSVSDLLFVFLDKYIRFTTFAAQKGDNYDNGKFERILQWD